jgi:hypothetical protein
MLMPEQRQMEHRAYGESHLVADHGRPLTTPVIR